MLQRMGIEWEPRFEALRIIREKNPELPHPETFAEQVCVGAVVFWRPRARALEDIDSV